MRNAKNTRWRKSISVGVREVCQAIIDKYKDEVLICSTSPSGSGVARGSKWGHAPWGAPAHFLQSFKNVF